MRAPSPDVERDVADRGLALHLDLGDAGSRRTGSAPCERPFDGRRGTFEHRFDRAVGPVPDPPSESEHNRLLTGGLAEPHTLDTAAHDQMGADAISCPIVLVTCHDPSVPRLHRAVGVTVTATDGDSAGRSEAVDARKDAPTAKPST
jgi:hypothetical protein